MTDSVRKANACARDSTNHPEKNSDTKDPRRKAKIIASNVRCADKTPVDF